MLAPYSFDYAVIRVTPFTEREEFFNAGVVLYCPQQRFLEARIHLDQQKLAAFAPAIPVSEVEQRLVSVLRICAGDPDAGPVARLSQRARFYWLAAPRSTLIQPSPIHSGVCIDPAAKLQMVFNEQVRTSR